MHEVRITSVGDPRLEDFRRVSDGELLRRRNLFVAEGRLVVGRLIESGQRITAILVNEASRRALDDQLSRLPDQVPVYVCESDDFESLTGFNLHRGCLAIAERPAAAVPEEVMRSCDRRVVLEGVTDADNVGSVFRNAAAFGARVLLSPTCCDPLYRKAIRTSMGSVMNTMYARLANWPDDLTGVKAAGFALVALTPRERAVDLAACPRPSRVALLVGTEGPGLSAAAEQMADFFARIPISGDVDSLNLATATGIGLYHFANP